MLLDLVVLASLVAALRGWLLAPPTRLARLLRPVVAAGVAFPCLYVAVVRPWHRRWGATDAEVAARFPGDQAVPDAGYQHTRAVTVDAPAERVWTWLAQIGVDRGGFYSYDRLENLAGCRVRSADRVHAEWQNIRPGDLIEVLPGWGPRLADVYPPRALVIRGWGTYVVEPLDARRCRLLARARQPCGWASLLYMLTLEIPHFVMERRMLLGIKERAERSSRRA